MALAAIQRPYPHHISHVMLADNELPYGAAWLLALAAELHAWADDGDRDGARHAATLSPLEGHTAGRLGRWIGRLSRPIRSGKRMFRSRRTMQRCRQRSADHG